MEIMDIIKESFIFPSQNIEKLAIYIVLTFLLGILAVGGIFGFTLGILNNNYAAIGMIVGAILFIVVLVLGFIISGYQVSILKSGIDFNEEAPGFDWKNDLITGIKMLVVGIVYMIIPAIVVLIVGLITNVPGQFMEIIKYTAASSTNATAIANGTTSAVSAIPNATMAAFGTSIAITAIVALIVFIIFAFLETMGESRLANTGSLGEALNIPEAFRDITRIGVGKVLGVILLVVVIVAVINAILGYVYGQIPQLSILSVIVAPYFTFFSQRAKGLLYSDIA